MKTKPLTFLISLAVLLFCSPAMSETTRSLSDEENQFLNRFLNKKFWYGLYFEREKFGHLYFDLYLDQKDQKEVVVFETATTSKASAEGEESINKVNEKYFFDKKFWNFCEILRIYFLKHTNPGSFSEKMCR